MVDGRNKNGNTGWSRYSERHRPKRVRNLPSGLTLPAKVRLYERGSSWLLQWWDPGVGKTLSERVGGDLLDALTRARAIDASLEARRTGGTGRDARLSHRDLVDSFKKDLCRRADAATLAQNTACRYASALDHYLAFTELPDVARRWRHAGAVDRDLALAFVAHLGRVEISPNGHPNTPRRRMKNPDYVVDVVRAMYEWATDPYRGNLLSEGFRSPFSRRSLERRAVVRDVFGEPDVTLPMAEALLRACDEYQLRLFAPMLFYGLRPGELVHACHEHVENGWLHIGCVDGLDYRTKGRRDKRLPLLDEVTRLLGLGAHGQGLLWYRRPTSNGSGSPNPSVPLAELVDRYRQRCVREHAATALAREAARAAVVAEAGGLTYDLVHGEFAGLAKRLGWPRAATLKDLRHLANTCLQNGGMPERDRQYLLGQSQGKAAIVSYTHLNRLREHYEKAVATEMAPLLEMVHTRHPVTNNPPHQS